MRPEIQAKLQKIQRSSSSVLRVCKVLFVLIGVQFVAEAVMLLAGRDGHLNSTVGSVSITGLSLHVRLMLLAACMMTSAVMAKFIFHLQRLFTGYSQGEIFTREAVHQLRQLGVTYLLWCVVANIWALLQRSISMQPGHSYHAHIESVATGVLLFIVARFMDMAVDLQEENALTI